jgi:hypothetical protein
MKVCTKCKTEKNESEFGKRNDRPTGLLSRCKECRKTYGNSYRKANKKELLQKNREKYQINRLEEIERQKSYRTKNRKKINSRARYREKKDTADLSDVYVTESLVRAGVNRAEIEAYMIIDERIRITSLRNRIFYNCFTGQDFKTIIEAATSVKINHKNLWYSLFKYKTNNSQFIEIIL